VRRSGMGVWAGDASNFALDGGFVQWDNLSRITGV